MNKPTTANNPLTLAIEHRIIRSGKDGTTASMLMEEMKVGKTCVRNHLRILEEEGRIYSTKCVSRDPYRPPFVYLLFRAGNGLAPAQKSARRDYLVAAFFGPA